MTDTDGTAGGPPVSGPPPTGEQQPLFPDALGPVLPDGVGYRGTTARQVAGITYRQLDYWARTGLVEPTVRGAAGSGTQRLYSFRDILALKVVQRLLETGVSLQNIRAAIRYLREQGTADLAHVTLMSDGQTVYECTSEAEVIDLVQGGQGVFGIAVGRIVREVESSLTDLPGELPEPSEALGADELAARRSRRSS